MGTDRKPPPSFDLTAFIQRHLQFSPDGVDYGNGSELLSLLTVARETFCREQEGAALIEVKIPVKIVGDIHGQFQDLLRIFLSYGLPGKQRYLFLGDYVDRGRNSVECISLLLALKLKAPDRIFLLRGNHECKMVNQVYGFMEELNRRFNVGIANQLYEQFNYLFGFMPLAALVRRRVLCMHGGLSPRLNSLDDIRRIALPIVDPYVDTLEQDLLWADPCLGISGFEPNKLREVSVSFGEDVVAKTCKRLKLDFVVRAHQMMPLGYGFFAKRKLVTVFSAPRYTKSMDNRGAVMSIDANMQVSFLIMNPVSKENQGPDHFKRTFHDTPSLSVSL